MPPSFLRIRAHSFAVEESIQMGRCLAGKNAVEGFRPKIFLVQIRQRFRDFFP